MKKLLVFLILVFLAFSLTKSVVADPATPNWFIIGIYPADHLQYTGDYGDLFDLQYSWVGYSSLEGYYAHVKINKLDPPTHSWELYDTQDIYDGSIFAETPFIPQLRYIHNQDDVLIISGSDSKTALTYLLFWPEIVLQ